MYNTLNLRGILCDLEKSFDCVNHNILLSKLEFYDIVGKFNALIKSCLTERYWRIRTGNRNTHDSDQSPEPHATQGCAISADIKQINKTLTVAKMVKS